MGYKSIRRQKEPSKVTKRLENPAKQRISRRILSSAKEHYATS